MNEQPENPDLEVPEEETKNEEDGLETPIDAVAALNAENETLVAENDEMKDRLLRTIAEMENLRKRTAREVSEARTYAIANFARDMLGATDNLSRALMTVPQEAWDSDDKTLKSLIEGIEMTEREMQRLLQANGVKPILAKGERFDPHKHQAMFEVPDSGAPDGTVVEVMQAGFAIGDRILRPAMVGVAKGSNKNAPSGQTAPNPSDEKQNGTSPVNEENKLHIDKEA